MRVNVYAEEMTQKVEIVEKRIDGQTFTGVRFWLELPVSYKLDPGAEGVIAPLRGSENGRYPSLHGPFMHHPGDNDSAAVTFWGKRDLRGVLVRALNLLDQHEEQKDTAQQHVSAKEDYTLPPKRRGELTVGMSDPGRELTKAELLSHIDRASSIGDLARVLRAVVARTVC